MRKNVTPESHASFLAGHLLVSENFGLKLNWTSERDGLRMRIQGRTMNQPISARHTEIEGPVEVQFLKLHVGATSRVAPMDSD